MNGKYRGGDAGRLDVGIELRLVGLAEAHPVRALTPECLHDPHAGEAFLQGREIVPDALAHLEVGAVRFPPEPPRGQHGRRDDHQHCKRQLPAQDDDGDRRAHEQQHVLHDRREPVLHELLERVDVGREARHEAAGLLAFVEVEPEMHEMPEAAHAQIAEERLTDLGREQDREAAEHEADHRDRHVRERGGVDGLGVVAADASVDPVGNQRGTGEQAPRLHHEAEHRQDHLPPPRPEHAPQAAGHAPGIATGQRVVLGHAEAHHATCSSVCGRADCASTAR